MLTLQKISDSLHAQMPSWHQAKANHVYQRNQKTTQQSSHKTHTKEITISFREKKKHQEF